MLQLISVIGNITATRLDIKKHLREAESFSEVKRRGSAICQKLHLQIVKKNELIFLNVTKTLNISSSIVHNIIKRLMIKEISVHNGEG